MIFVLYSVLFRFVLIPRALVALGMGAALLQSTAVAMSLFGQPINFLLIMPLGLSHLTLAAWLMARSFEERQQPASISPEPVPPTAT